MAEMRLELTTLELGRTLKRIEDYKVFAAKWLELALTLLGDLSSEAAMLAQPPDGQPKPRPLAGSWHRHLTPDGMVGEMLMHDAIEVARREWQLRPSRYAGAEGHNPNHPPFAEEHNAHCGIYCADGHRYDLALGCMLGGERRPEQARRYPPIDEQAHRHPSLPDSLRDSEKMPYVVKLPTPDAEK